MDDIMNLGPDEKITLDRRTFKVLASNTRSMILKALEGTQKTVSDLARELNMNKATMYQHLEQLREVGLVKRLDGKERMKTVKKGPHQAPMDGAPRKWVYYKLSWKGKNIVNPGKVRFAVMLSIIGIIGIAVILLVAATVVYNPAKPGDMEMAKDVLGPSVEDWDTPTPNTNVATTGPSAYSFRVDIEDASEGKVSGLREESIRFYYGIGDREEMFNPNVVGWTEISHDKDAGGTYSARIDGVDWVDMGGKYLYLKVTAADVAGNIQDSVRHIYIVQFNEADIIFGDNGKFVDNGLYGSRGVYVEGGGSGGGSYAFGAQVTNTGDQPTGTFKVKAYSVDPDQDDDGWSDPDLKEYTLVTFDAPSLEPGETVNLTTATLTLSDIRSQSLRTSVDSDHIYFMVDPDNKVKEEDDLNNVQKVDDPGTLLEDIELNGGAGPKETGAQAADSAPGFQVVVAFMAAALALVAMGRNRPRRD
jgi:DNA-binding transcriptional ArsR family regulator